MSSEEVNKANTASAIRRVNRAAQNPEFEVLMRMADDIHTIAKAFTTPEADEKNIYAQLSAAYNFCSLSLEDVLNNGDSDFKIHVNLRAIAMQWRAMADAYVKKQSDLDKGNDVPT